MPLNTTHTNKQTNNLSTQLHGVSDVESRRRLRSASTTALVVPRTHHQTIGDRAVPVAAAHVWNSLSSAVTMSTSLSFFQRNLKTELFARSYPDASYHSLRYRGNFFGFNANSETSSLNHKPSAILRSFILYLNEIGHAFVIRCNNNNKSRYSS